MKISALLFLVCHLVITAALCVSGAALAADYADDAASARARCEAIDPKASVSGLWLNPDGYQAYYAQSECYQRFAIQFRQLSACDHVREKWALFSSTWGYSESNCRAEVEKGIASDTEELRSLRRAYLANPVRLTALTIERNGNGRDYDFIPSIGHGFRHAYHLSIWAIVDAKRYPLTQQGFHLSGGENLRLFETSEELAARVPGFSPPKTLAVEADLVLDIGTGGYGTRWSPEFIAREFPRNERRQTIELVAEF